MANLDELLKLKSLLDSGSLNHEEFAKLKNEILFSNDIKPKIESKEVDNFTKKTSNLNIPKPNSYQKNNTENNYLFNYLFVIGSIIAIIFYFNKNTSTNKTELPNQTETISGSKNYNSVSNETNYNTCSICGRQFSGRGYDEVSEGNWQLLTEGQGSICSIGCGRKHTQEMNRIMNKYNINTNSNNDGYHNGNDGRIYENNACSLCKGTGIETGRNVATGEIEGRVCPMCEGRGVKSY